MLSDIALGTIGQMLLLVVITVVAVLIGPSVRPHW